jgi:hypothetical protein
MEQADTNRGVPGAITAALAALPLTPGAEVRFPGEDGGSSLAEMAQSDLDAALQLLADRAQYITGANGAAIALRRRGKNDMQCRASAGENVPELGALLSTEFGLSGESVRTRRALRCDDAERDPRVNREGCRQLGIASVVVMPVVNDDEVLGVFELFSGKVNAFGERDLSALQRLSEMVETAVKLARAAETIPGHAQVAEVAAAAVEPVGGAGAHDETLGDEILAVHDASGAKVKIKEDVIAALEALRHPKASAEAPAAEAPAEELELPTAASEAESNETGLGSNLDRVPSLSSDLDSRSPLLAQDASNRVPGVSAAPAKPLFWSAAMNPLTEAGTVAEPDRSHVPPGLRNLRSCEACGFPVSLGRALCVECEEKRWRGQLKRPSAVLGAKVGLVSQTVIPPATIPPSSERPSSQPSSQQVSQESKGPQSPRLESLKAGVPAKDARNGAPGVEAAESGPVARLIAAAAQSAATAPALIPVAEPGPSVFHPEVVAAPGVVALPLDRQELGGLELDGPGSDPNEVDRRVPAPIVDDPAREVVSETGNKMQEVATPDFVLTAGLEPSRSWLANLYMVVVLLLVAAAVAATILLH